MLTSQPWLSLVVFPGTPITETEAACGGAGHLQGGTRRGSSLLPAGEEQQNCFESVAGRELPFFSVQGTSSCCSAARSPQGLAGGTLLSFIAHHGREALAAFQGGRIPSSLSYFYLALCQAHLIALVSSVLVLLFPLVLLFLNLII